MPGAVRPACAAVLLAVGLAAGCGTVGGVQSQPAGPSSEPVSSPRGGPPPAGTVLDIGAPASAVVVDPRTRTVAVAGTDPPRLLLHSLNGPLDGTTVPHQVPLPGPAADLVLAAEGGPLLVPVSVPGSLLRVPLGDAAPKGAAVSRTDLDAGPRGAVTVGGWTVVALGDRLVVLEGAEVRRTVTGFTDAARLVPAGTKVAVLDRGRAAVSLVDPGSGRVGPALRAGNGAADAVVDRFGRILVTDVADGELLVFAGDPLLLRQRAPMPGGPYGLAYDARRDMAWVTLTARNEVVGLRVIGGEPVEVYRFPTVHQPDAVAVDPASGRVLVASASGAGLQVIDPERVVY